MLDKLLDKALEWIGGFVVAVILIMLLDYYGIHLLELFKW